MLRATNYTRKQRKKAIISIYEIYDVALFSHSSRLVSRFSIQLISILGNIFNDSIEEKKLVQVQRLDEQLKTVKTAWSSFHERNLEYKYSLNTQRQGV